MPDIEAGDAEPRPRDEPPGCLAEARDLRRPWAEEGRPGESMLPAGELNPTGGDEGVQEVPASSAVS